ncbi:MAG: YihY/virulence factor BrkB family protein [Candidatus Delongbacteria bacterium]|nr:YihY/virulence factor BrkB family protein [Candidatus Delongbacteria bacterium]
MISRIYTAISNWLDRRFIYRVLDRFSQDNASLLAAGISYYAMLSLFPFVMVAFAFFGSYLKREDIFIEIINYIGHIIPQALTLIEQNLDFLVRSSKINTLIGILGLMWTSNKIFCAVENALHQIWKVKDGRQYFIHKFRATFLVLPLVSMIYFSIMLTSFLQTAANLQAPFFHFPFYPSSFLLISFKYIISASISILYFYLAYRIIPKSIMKRRYVFIGAVIGGGLWELSKISFSVFLNRIISSFSLYGSLATLLVMIFWIYFTATIFLLGAEFIYSFQVEYGFKKES